ncbi:MAG: hypothetical protein M3R54_00310 [Chloroflexota bacterium]|nr:hypothetical protein [Chloroflexota bacterium]
MAGALRPVLILMLLASVLFVAAGVLDGAYPGGSTSNLAFASISYVFAIVNTGVAYLVARGSERSLALRMGLSLFFVFERPASAFFTGDKSTASVVVHLVTAVVELIILIFALRVWRLGHSLESGEMDKMLSFESGAPTIAAVEREEAAPRAFTVPRGADGTLPVRTAWLIGLTTLLLAAILVADGVVSGFVPDGRQWGVSGESSGWLVYLFAVVLLTVATRAVKGGRLALRLLAITALIFFMERAFSPFALRVIDPVVLGLHGLAAFVALAVALSAASAIRGSRARPEGDAPSLEAA